MMALAVLAALQNVPEELRSPFLAPGDADAYLGSLGRFDNPESRDAALAVLEAMPDTRRYVGDALPEAVREQVRQQVLRDLKAAVWADLD
jgi:hypothetical protein